MASKIKDNKPLSPKAFIINLSVRICFETFEKAEKKITGTDTQSKLDL